METRRFSPRTAALPAWLAPLLCAVLMLLPACAPVDESAREKQAEETAEASAEPADDPPLTPARRELTTQIRELGGQFAGEVGIGIEEVASGWTASYNGRELFPQQSVSKLWVALATFDRIDRGKLALDKPVTVGRDDLAVFHQPIRDLALRKGGYRTDIADLLERALTQSDNTANDVLLWRIGGPARIRQVLAAKALPGIRFGPGERKLQSVTAGMKWRPEFSLGQNFWEARDEVPHEKREAAFNRYLADPPDGAQPLAIASALAELERGELLSEQATERLLAILHRTHSGPRRLKGGLPDGWSIAHKTGTGQNFGQWQAGYNDVGIVTSPEGRDYAVAVMIRKTSQPIPERMELMQQVVRAIAAYDRARSEEQARGPEARERKPQEA